MYFIQSNLGNNGNFELVVREGNQLRHYWRDNDDPSFPWHKGDLFGDNVSSAPALIQSNLGDKGNFEVVVVEGNGYLLRHYYRDNDDPNFTWHKGEVILSEDLITGLTMIQSNLGTKGNFELVVTGRDDLYLHLRHYWRDNDDPDLTWHKGDLFGDKVFTEPTMIQSNFGKKGNFEVVVGEGGPLRHYYRDNDDPDMPWIKREAFGDNVFAGPTMIQSNLGIKGNFEVVAIEQRNRLHHYWRDNDDPNLTWHEDEVSFGEAADCNSSMIQSNLGNKRNFEVVIIEFRERNHLVHYYRDNDVPSKWNKGAEISDTNIHC
jgi:hypothetical protein